MTPEEFKQDIQKSKKILEDIAGTEVIGYRAPSYSITRKSLWAFEILAEEGYRYDSSIFPIHHDRYGIPDAPRFPFVIPLNGNANFEFSALNVESRITPNSELRTPHLGLCGGADVSGNSNPQFEIRNSKSILEFPISTMRILGRNLPISGGGYFRLLPYSIVKKGLKEINEKERMPFVFYLHPWEFDPDQPQMSSISKKSRFRHYVNLNKTENRFETLLSDFNFSSIEDVLNTKVSIYYSEPQAERSSNL
jgi:hypothetical protein